MKKCLITKDIASFMHRGKAYLPGDVVELPDEYPAGLYSFLKPIPSEVEHDPEVQNYKRKDPFDVKPLMVVMSVRRIPEVLEAFERLDFIDKVYFRNFTPAQVSDEINDYLRKHIRHYTHILVSSDDIAPSPDHIRQLVQDVADYDLPVVAGFCNQCLFDRQDEHSCICGCCIDGRPHPTTNVTLQPVDTMKPIHRNLYSFLSMEWALNHPGIHRVWFQGMACGMIRKDIHKKVPFRSFAHGVGGLMQDLAFAEDLARKNIPQFVDFRVNIRHYGTHHGKLLVGIEEKRVEFEWARRHLGDEAIRD